jgi:hypothetical protein
MSFVFVWRYDFAEFRESRADSKEFFLKKSSSGNFTPVS